MDKLIIVEPNFSMFRRDNNSFKKPGQSSNSTAFIRGFDSSLGEDQVIRSAKHFFLGT
jgi:hypothetical protein